MSRLNPEKLHVQFIAPITEVAPILSRYYTLTHSDRTGDLFLTIGPDYHYEQFSGRYARFMRDEVLAEWLHDPEGYTLHAHCQVSRGFGPTRLRKAIFHREFPLALEALRYGDRHLFNKHPYLDDAPILIHFHTKKEENDWVENWQTFSTYKLEEP